MAYQGTLATVKDDLQLLLRLADEDMESGGPAERWINLGYLDAVQRTEENQFRGVADMTEDEDSYYVPDPVLMIKQLSLIYPDGSKSRPLQSIDLELLLEKRRGTLATGQTVDRPFYTLVGQELIEVWPAPSEGTQLEFWYVAYPDALEDDDAQPVIREPFGSKLLLYSAAVEAARFKKDPLLGDYEAAYSYWIDRFQAHLNRGRNLSQFVLHTGDDDYRPHDPSQDWYGR